jgi:phosphomannomutase
LAYLFQLQNKLIIENLGNLPLTGTFFDYRGSMLNWCPIGRNASSRERILWENLNKDELIRTPILNQINSYLNRGNKINLTAKLGGDTSFDIFPRGWDKTFPIDKMNMFSDCNVYFIGDRCHESGNDYELYNHPKTTAYQTTSTEDTIKIVNKIISSNV